MQKIFFLVLCLGMIAGCGYKQPSLNESYGIIQATGSIIIHQIDGKEAINLSGNYIFRISPGSHTLLLGQGHNEKTPVEGSDSPYASFPISIEEGYRYYLGTELIYGHEDVMLGYGFKAVKAWKPIIKKCTAIKGYKKKASQDFGIKKQTLKN